MHRSIKARKSVKMANRANNQNANQQNANQANRQQQAVQEEAQRVLAEENARLREELERLRAEQAGLAPNAADQPVHARLAIPKFNPAKISIRTWLRKYKAESARANWSNEAMVRFLAEHVDDEAVNFVLENDQLPFDDLEKRMVEEFEDKNRAELNEVMEVQFDFKSKVEDWVQAKREAGKKLRLTKDQVMAAITNKLPANLQWIRTEEQLPTLYKAVREERERYGQIQRLTRQLQMPGGGQSGASASSGGYYSSGGGYSLSGQLRDKRSSAYTGGRLNKYQRTGDRPAASYCFHCHDYHNKLSYDHYSRNCPCPNKTNEERERANKKKQFNNVEPREEVGEVTKLIYFPVSVNGVECQALYDPGASISAIDEKLARRTGIQVVDRPTVINSGTIDCSGVAIVRLKVNMDTKLVLLYVVNYVNLKDRVLLGLNCLRAFGLTHDRDLNIVNFDRTFVIKTSASESNDSVNLLEINNLLQILESETKEENNENESENELAKAINHLIVNDSDKFELALNPEVTGKDKEKILAILRKTIRCLRWISTIRAT